MSKHTLFPTPIKAISLLCSSKNEHTHIAEVVLNIHKLTPLRFESRTTVSCWCQLGYCVSCWCQLGYCVSCWCQLGYCVSWQFSNFNTFKFEISDTCHRFLSPCGHLSFMDMLFILFYDYIINVDSKRHKSLNTKNTRYIYIYVCV